MNSKLKLHVYLSRNGVASRRKAMALVLEGRVSVNGKKNNEPSTIILSESTSVAVDGVIITQKKYQYLILNKSAGYVTTKAQFKNQKSVYDLIPQKYEYLSPVGRLDKDTEGLLLLTNDGDLAYTLTHPKFNIEKIYYVKLKGVISQEEVRQIQNGVMIERKKTAPAKIRNIKRSKNETTLDIIIHEGKKRQVRLMFSKFGKEVIYLQRVAQGPLTIDKLNVGEYRMLNQKEIKLLKNLNL